jgi:hypothetical protein
MLAYIYAHSPRSVQVLLERVVPLGDYLDMIV